MAKKPISAEDKVTEVASEFVTPAVRQRLEEKKYSRTTIVVDPDLYKQFKAFAASNGTTVTALLNEAMRNILGY